MYLSKENKQRNILIEVYIEIIELDSFSLTISGISKAEKIERSENELDRVALQNKYNKHLNQLHLSGGQYQIVEIAGALIINLEILFGYNIYHLLF